jgi:hypothetical protein
LANLRASVIHGTLANQRAIMDEAARQLAQVDTSDIERQLGLLGEQEEAALDLLGTEPTERLRERMHRIREQRAKLTADLQAKQREAEITEIRRALVRDLGENAVQAFDHLTPDEQGTIYRELVRNVRIRATGQGPARQYELLSYEPAQTLLSDGSS